MASIVRWTGRLIVYPKVYLGALLATLVWHLFLFFGAAGSNAGRIAVLAAAPAAFLAVWAVAAPIGLLRKALQDDAQAGSGWRILLAHLGSVTLQLVGFSAVLVLSGLWVVLHGIGVPKLLDLLPIPVIDWFVWMVLRGLGVGLVVMALVAAVAQCAYAVSRLTERFHRFLLLWSGLMLAWAVLRALPRLSEWLGWLPHISFEEFVLVGDGFELQRAYYESAPFAAALILAALLAVLAGWIYGVLKNPGIPHSEAAAAAPDPGGGAPRRILDRRERLLIFVAALSLAFVYDVFENGSTVEANLRESLIRPVVALQDDLGFLRGAPFVASQGSLVHPARGVTTFVARVAGDVRITRAKGQEISVDYAVRTYAASQRAAQTYHELVGVGLMQSGERLELVLQAPPADGSIHVRVRYDIALPPGIQVVLDARYGSVEAYDVAGRITATLQRASMRATSIQGDVEVEAVDGDVWLTGIDGDVTVNHLNGRVEVHGVAGEVSVTGEHTTFESTDVDGSVTARLTRSLARLYQVRGDVDVEALMTRIRADKIEGKTSIRGTLSPIVLSGLTGPAELVSDRGNVTAYLDPALDWNVRLASRRGEVMASFPEEFSVSSSVENRQRVVTAVKGTGATTFRSEISGADLTVEVRPR